MAKRPPRQVARGQPAAVRRKSMTPLWVAVGVVLVVTISLPSVLLLFFGMLPTMVAFIIDRSRQKHAMFSVGGMNFSGVFPFLLNLWTGEHTVNAATNMLTDDPFTLAMMYGAAGLGWLLYISVPPVVTAFLTVMAQHRIAQLRTTQTRIIEEWGEDVAQVVATEAEEQ